MTNLPDILDDMLFDVIVDQHKKGHPILNVTDLVKEAQAAIAELVEGCLPKKRRGGASKDFLAGRREIIDEIRNNLIKAGVLK